MKELKDYILVVPNIVPSELCNVILAEYKNSDDWIDATIDNGANKDVRNCQTIGLSLEDIIQKNLEKRQSIDKNIFKCAVEAIKEYIRNTPVIPKGAYLTSKDTGYELLKYETGGFYSEHLDFSERTPRAISCSFILNDDYEGGEFAFFNRELKYKPKKGSCIMFPSNFMYPHEIMPVASGTRYSIITWFV
jgi:predicted 2-oxoglutarate/Fe(II)-dependent dioxygenase YbiX